MAANTIAGMQLTRCLSGNGTIQMPRQLQQPTCRGSVRPARQMQRITAAASLSDQDSEKRAAKERWQTQLVEGRVKNVSAAAAGELLADGFVLLDVRPPEEISKAEIKGAVKVPIFIEEPSNDPISLLKKMSALSMGGLWLGGTHMKPNPAFMRDVQSQIPKDARILVTCQKGLRSLAAAEQLHRAGYSTLAWINGGLDSSRKGDLPSVGDVDLRYGGIGGLTEALGLTEVQREEGTSNSSKYGAIFVKLGIAVIVGDFLLFVFEYATAVQNGTAP